MEKRILADRTRAWLLDEMRMHGETRELKDEVVRLARSFGIVTPYTSYLVVEDIPQQVATNRPPPPILRPWDGAPPPARSMPSREPKKSSERVVNVVPLVQVAVGAADRDVFAGNGGGGPDGRQQIGGASG